MMNSSGSGDAAVVDPAGLTISEVSRRTGIPAAGLRNWEQRYGLPRPQRSPTGQRRYREADCDLLADVLRHRAGGLSLPAAMARATAASAAAASGSGQSIFAGVRHRHPDLLPAAAYLQARIRHTGVGATAACRSRSAPASSSNR
jgi:hypothetical protein